MSDTGLSARKIERILRDAGISKSVARAIVANGWKAGAAAGEDGGNGADAEAAAALAQHINAAAARLRKGFRNDH